MRVRVGLGVEGGRGRRRWRRRVVGALRLGDGVVLMVGWFRMLAVPSGVKTGFVIEEALYLGEECRQQVTQQGPALPKPVRCHLALLLVVKTALVFLDALRLVENCVLVRVSLIEMAA